MCPMLSTGRLKKEQYLAGNQLSLKSQAYGSIKDQGPRHSAVLRQELEEPQTPWWLLGNRRHDGSKSVTVDRSVRWD